MTQTQFSSVHFSHSVVSDSLRPHESQHARPPLSITNSQSSLRLTSIESVMPSSHLILCCPPSPPAPNAILRQFKEKYVYMYVCIYVCKYVQFVAQSCPTLCNFIDYCTPGFPVHHQLLELAHILESVMPSNHLVLCCPFSSCLQPFQASGSFLVSQFSALAGQSIGVSTSASVLPVTIQN